MTITTEKQAKLDTTKRAGSRCFPARFVVSSFIADRVIVAEHEARVGQAIGQPLGTTRAITKERIASLYAIDRSLPHRKSHEDPVIQKLYERDLGAPLSPKAHDLPRDPAGVHILKPPVSTSVEKLRTPSTDVRGFFAQRGFLSAPFSSLPCALLARLRHEFRQRLLSKAGVIADVHRRILDGDDAVPLRRAAAPKAQIRHERGQDGEVDELIKRLVILHEEIRISHSGADELLPKAEIRPKEHRLAVEVRKLQGGFLRQRMRRRPLQKLHASSSFQSTLPRGERLGFDKPCLVLHGVSIHAPTRGATQV